MVELELKGQDLASVQMAPFIQGSQHLLLSRPVEISASTDRRALSTSGRQTPAAAQLKKGESSEGEGGVCVIKIPWAQPLTAIRANPGSRSKWATGKP